MELIAEFYASIPDIQSAVSISGQGSARIKLDIPESELAEILKLTAFGKGALLRFQVYREDMGKPNEIGERRPWRQS